MNPLYQSQPQTTAFLMSKANQPLADHCSSDCSAYTLSVLGTILLVLAMVAIAASGIHSLINDDEY